MSLLDKLVKFEKKDLISKDITNNITEEKIIPTLTNFDKSKTKLDTDTMVDKEEKQFDIKDFLVDLAISSEFERLIYKAIFGKVIRGSNEEAEKKLEQGIKKFREFINK